MCRNIISRIDQHQHIIVIVKMILRNGMKQISQHAIHNNVVVDQLNEMHIIHTEMGHVKKKNGMKMNGDDQGTQYNFLFGKDKIVKQKYRLTII